MKISIITCSFNRLDKLKRNIQSVISQNYDDYEHFIIDDGSTDGTKDYIYKLNNKKIIYYRSDKNLGQPKVMFKSNVLNNINGKIIFLLDSDDYLLDNAIYTIIEDFKKFDGGIQTIAYSYENDGKQIEYKKVKSSYILKDNHPLNANNNGFKDYLFVQTSDYIKNFNFFFKNPYRWYTSRIEYALSENFYEVYTNKVIYNMDFGNDTVTKGANIEKYADITLFTRKYYFDNFRINMGNKYIRYTIKSLLLNILISKNNKFYFISYFKKAKSLKLINLYNQFLFIILYILPSNFLFKIKIFLKKNRFKR
mgnify:CR=1 FL=1